MKNEWSFLPEFDIILEWCQQSWSKYDFLKCLKVFLPSVKPRQIMLLFINWTMLTFAINPLMLIAHMMQRTNPKCLQMLKKMKSQCLQNNTVNPCTSFAKVIFCAFVSYSLENASVMLGPSQHTGFWTDKVTKNLHTMGHMMVGMNNKQLFFFTLSFDSCPSQLEQQYQKWFIMSSVHWEIFSFPFVFPSWNQTQQESLKGDF